MAVERNCDKDAVARSAPGAKTRLVAVDVGAALAARAERGRRLQSLGAAVDAATAVRDGGRDFDAPSYATVDGLARR